MEFWFMNYKDILAMTVLFVLLPMWVGYLWAEFLKLREGWNRIVHAWVLGFVTMLAVAQVILVPLVALEQTWVGYLWAEFLKLREGWNRIVHAWVLGFVTMLAVAQVILVPLVALEQTLTTAMILWKMALTVFSIFSFGLLLRRWKRGKLVFLTGSADAWEESHTEAGDRSRKGWVYIFGTLAAVMILLQAYIPARYEHGDDDDARFISEEVSAVEHDTMYIDDPISGSEMYWDQGEVKKDLTSPWAMYIAMCSRISGIHPAVLSHTYLPFFLILLCYAVYLLIGHVLMRGDWEKTFLFLIFLSVVHLWGYTSTHTLASMLLLRIWQGKAVCASFLIPLFFYLMYRLMHREYRRGWLALLYVAATGGCLLSGIGITTVPVILLLYGIVDFLTYRDRKKTVMILMAAVPNAAFLLYYLIR